MWRMKVLFYSFVVWFSINQSFATLIWYREISRDDYKKSRDASLYRGLFLTTSFAEAYELCFDVIYAQQKRLNPDTELMLGIQKQTDGQSSKIMPELHLFVGKVDDKKGDEVIFENEDIVLVCTGPDFDKIQGKPDAEVLISFAFRPSTGYVWINIEDNPRITLLRMILFGASPKYVPLKPDQLEEQYLKTRRTIETLRRESDDYIQLIERNDNLSALSIDDKRSLCSLILSAPIYREEGLEYFQEQKEEKNLEQTLRYQQKWLEFSSEKYLKENQTIDGIICKAKTKLTVQDLSNNSDSESAATDESINESAAKPESIEPVQLPPAAKDEESDDSDEESDDFDEEYELINLYLIRSYDNDNSLYVVNEQDNHIFLSKYFKRISLLMNA